MNPALLRLCNDTIPRYPVKLASGQIQREDGQALRCATPQQHRGKIERGNRVVKNAEGREIPTTARLFIAGPVAINPEDKLIVDGKPVTIVSLTHHSELFSARNSHAEVYVA